MEIIRTNQLHLKNYGGDFMNKKCRALSKEEYESVVSTIKYGFEYKGIKVQPNVKIATAFVVQANTGLRIGDLLQLKLKDIVKESGRYHFNIVEQKTKKHRVFTIAPEIYTYLQEYALEHNIRTDRRLFDIGIRGIQKHLKMAVGYLGYENVGTHSFRKFFAMSIYNDNQYNVELVRELLQHSSVAVTQHYLGVSPQIVEKALLNHVYIPAV